MKRNPKKGEELKGCKVDQLEKALNFWGLDGQTPWGRAADFLLGYKAVPGRGPIAQPKGRFSFSKEAEGEAGTSVQKDSQPPREADRTEKEKAVRIKKTAARKGFEALRAWSEESGSSLADDTPLSRVMKKKNASSSQPEQEVEATSARAVPSFSPVVDLAPSDGEEGRTARSEEQPAFQAGGADRAEEATTSQPATGVAQVRAASALSILCQFPFVYVLVLN